jgi:hypothetical protein
MSPAATINKTQLTEFPPVGDLIKQTWEVTKDKWKAFLKVMAVVAGIEILLAVVLFGVLFALGAVNTAAEGTPFGIVSSPLMIVALIVWAIPAIAVGTVGSIAMYRLAIEEKLSEMPVLDLLRDSMRYVVPIIVVGLITALLVTGGFFALIIPGIIFSILFAFAPLEVLFEGKSPVTALKTSASMVRQHFGAIFVRWLAFVGVMLLSAIVMGIIEGIFGQESVINGLVQLVYNFVVTVFSTIYFTLLYKQVRGESEAEASYSLTWVIIVSVVGWVLGLFIISSAISGLANYFNQYSETEMESFSEDELLRELESLEQELNLEEAPALPEEAI